MGVLHRRTNLAATTALDQLPGLGAQIEADGLPAIRGSVVEVADNRMVVDVRSPSKAALLAAATAARLTVVGPADWRFVTTADVTMSDASRVSLTVADTPQLVRRSA